MNFWKGSQLPATQQPARRGRPKVVDEQERRAVILEAAHDAFVELGFARTTTAVVAARARVSKRSLYELFTDKTQLFGEMIRARRHTILALPRPAGEEMPLFDVLVAIFRLDIGDRAEQEREAILNLINREASQFPELSAYLYENDIIRSRELLIEWLEQQRVRMAVDDPGMLAGMLMDIVFGALLPRRKLQTLEDRAARTDHIKKRLEIFIRGTRA